jgi:hypothetical protein
VEHEFEFESEWKQVGSLANSVLRSVMEKRRQAELLQAISHSPAIVPPAPGEFRAQLDLPLFSSVALAAVNRELSHL